VASLARVAILILSAVVAVVSESGFHFSSKIKYHDAFQQVEEKNFFFVPNFFKGHEKLKKKFA